MRQLLAFLLPALLLSSYSHAQRHKTTQTAVDLGVDAGYSGAWEKVKKGQIRIQFYNKSDKTVYLLPEITPHLMFKRWYLPSGTTDVVSKKSSATSAWTYKAPLIPVEPSKAIPFELSKKAKNVSVVFVVLHLPDLKTGTDKWSLEELLHDYPPVGSYRVAIHENQTGFVSFDSTKGLYPETGTWGGWSGQTRSGLSNANNIAASQIEILNIRDHNVKQYFPRH